MEVALAIRDLYKHFGAKAALQGLSLAVPLGAVTGLIGANGAGKTTTFSILGGFLFPDEGEIEVLGIPLAEYRARGGILGLSPQDALFFEDRSVAQQLTLFARLSGFYGSSALKEVGRVLELTKLTDRAKDRVEVLSHGMRVRLGIAQALIAEPPIVLLDEPTAGLDPFMVQEFTGLVENLRGATTLVISSHDLSVLESVCDHVCMIHEGQLVTEGSLDQIVASQNSVFLRADILDPVLAGLKAMLPLQAVHVHAGSVFEFVYDPAAISQRSFVTALLKCCVEKSIDVQGLETKQSLSKRFIEATRPSFS